MPVSLLHAREAVIVDYARSAMGRSKNGVFRHIRGDDISAAIIKGLLARNPRVDPGEIDDLLWGCVMQREEQGFNIARNILLLTDLPHTVPAQTINRLCGSSMSALHIATANIRAGLGDVYLIGGVEHMGHLPMYESVNPNPLLGLSVAKAAGNMGITAEYLARLHGIERRQMDEFGARSHQLAARARAVDGLGGFARLSNRENPAALACGWHCSILRIAVRICHGIANRAACGAWSLLSSLPLSGWLWQAAMPPPPGIDTRMATGHCASAILGCGNSGVVPLRLPLHLAFSEYDDGRGFDNRSGHSWTSSQTL
jgi:hypothetical protein